MDDYSFIWNSANGPKVEYIGGLDDEVYEGIAESAAELGYSVDWMNQVRLSPAFQPDSAGECRYASPLVWFE